MVVTFHDATLATRRALPLTWAGLAPAGSRLLRLAHPFNHPNWLFDFKYDGFRALCYVEPGRSRFLSRHGNTLSRFDRLAEQVAAVMDVHDAILVGEVIATDETGRPEFYELLRRTQAPACVASADALQRGRATVLDCRSRGLLVTRFAAARKNPLDRPVVHGRGRFLRRYMTQRGPLLPPCVHLSNCFLHRSG